jgi:hypothetical protein
MDWVHYRGAAAFLRPERVLVVLDDPQRCDDRGFAAGVVALDGRRVAPGQLVFGTAQWDRVRDLLATHMGDVEDTFSPGRSVRSSACPTVVPGDPVVTGDHTVATIQGRLRSLYARRRALRRSLAEIDMLINRASDELTMAAGQS